MPENSFHDPLQALLIEPERALIARQRSARQAELLAQARAVEADQGIDAYWAWAAGHLRWMRHWDQLRDGGFGDARWFSGGLLNVCDNCVDRHAEDPLRGTRDALIWEGEPGDVVKLTYQQLRDATARCANGFRSLGIGTGDVVALYLPNLPETLIAIHACNRIGAIYTILFAGFSPEAINLRLRTARAKLVVTADASWRRGKHIPLLDNVRTACATTPEVQHVVVIDRCGLQPQLRANEIAYASLIAEQSTICPCVPLEANAPSFLIFTSGTESKPKGLVHSVGGFLLGTWANVQWQIGPEDEDIYWCATDVGWLTFPIHAVVGALAHGATVVWYEGAIDSPTIARVYQIAHKHLVTKILTAPTVLRMLKAQGAELAHQHPLPNLKLISVQGEPLDSETFHWTTQTIGTDLSLINAYGQTETGATWTLPVAGVDALKAGSCGRPSPGFRCSIVDAAGQAVPAGVKGNLVLTSPFPGLARTIWDDHERYLKTYFYPFPGTYCTADEAVSDHNGHLWVLGRSDDVINVAAHRISTMEIESIAAAQEGVADAAIVGINEAVKGCVPVAFLSLRSGFDAAAVEAAVRGAVERGIGGIARLGNVYFCATLPKTRAGKTMRRLLREAAETGAVKGDITGLEDAGAVKGVLDAISRQAAQNAHSVKVESNASNPPIK